MNPQPAGDLPPVLNADTLAMLACLREAVADALERKRRLGQYWVEWSPTGPQFRGPGAPKAADGGAGGKADPGSGDQ